MQVRQSLLPPPLSVPGKKYTQLENKRLKGMVTWLRLSTVNTTNIISLLPAQGHVWVLSSLAFFSSRQLSKGRLATHMSPPHIRSQGFSRKSLLRGWLGSQCLITQRHNVPLGCEPVVTSHVASNSPYARAFREETS